MEQANPFAHLFKDLQCGDHTYKYYDLKDLNDARLEKLPYSIRVLLESAIRNCDEFAVKSKYLTTQLTIFCRARYRDHPRLGEELGDAS